MDESDYLTDITVVEAIVRKIASLEEIDPIELEPPLYDAIDPDALQRLLQSSEAVETVRFTYAGWVVDVRGDGRVSVHN